ncbi:hypothetical protein [Nocardiopsis sp. MG754419]|uniref:hypothetical protein n=1 Tax=Nocardiopsis sp. MG754419 TaxID=2259865 RepID=UPI001BA6EA57|nr:hypothetical protein [Nocardiopsis sp. MG754419]MBR8744031.1 hypothetical protein [Nocardiopsis sp. MG754419]
MSDVPQAVIPFVIDRAAAEAALTRWAEGLWFAPRRVRRAGVPENLRPVFVPYRVFEADTVSHYEGWRGDHYWVEQVRGGPAGRPETTGAHEVRDTSWRRVRGTLERHFGDVVVCATTRSEGAERLGAWLLNTVVAPTPDAVRGVEVITADTTVEHGWERAEQAMHRAIERACAEEIGGDEQRVDSVRSTLADPIHTLALMPVWAGSYRLRGRVRTVVVNGRTGHVEGDQPFSRVKLAAAFAGLIALAELSLEMFFR